MISSTRFFTRFILSLSALAILAIPMNDSMANAYRTAEISQSLYSESSQEVERGLTVEDRKILWALNQQEASGRSVVESRFEPDFYKRYLKDNSLFTAAEIKFGMEAISSSYGPWQIMYTTAVEMGYRGSPKELAKASVSLPYVLRYIEKLKGYFDGNVQQVLSAYNAGPGGVGTNPIYTNKVMSYYQKAPASWRVYGSESFGRLS